MKLYLPHELKFKNPITFSLAINDTLKTYLTYQYGHTKFSLTIGLFGFMVGLTLGSNLVSDTVTESTPFLFQVAKNYSPLFSIALKKMSPTKERFIRVRLLSRRFYLGKTKPTYKGAA
jgi:hypothetical protein